MERNPHKKEIAYYLTLFTLEGHTTWRAHLGGTMDAFEIEQKNWSGKHKPKVTDKRVLRIDRLTGTFSDGTNTIQK